ncbi:murein biosynthesis integral membrane protein MurJ [Streptomyces sp. YIM S03343]
MTVTPSRSPGADADAHSGARTRARSRARAGAPTGADEAAVTSAAPPRSPAHPAHQASPPHPAETAPSRAFLARATLVTASLSLAGAVLGLVRDQALARLFGAGSATDAFLVAWTVPEFAATLLIEDGLAFALIPAFSAALARRARDAPGDDPVRALVAGTLPRLTLSFVAVSALLVAAAPVLVRALAPGLPHPGLAVDCTRLTATCVLSFGLAGYCSAALRAHRRFGAPAAIYVAYNSGIVTGMLVLGGHWGVRSAAAGVAVGGLLMVAAQLPSLLGQLRTRPTDQGTGGSRGRYDTAVRPLSLELIGAVLLFALCRQSQVLVERFLASGLPSGAISHLNYAQKVAQLPMVLSLMLCTVTFPVVTRALAEGDTERARRRVERDLALVACLVLLGTAAVVACAPQIIELLFQRGAFTAHDTAATAGVMRVYALGLLSQTLVGVLIRSYFSTGRATWYPLGAMTTGVVVTAWAGALAVGPWGAAGIAAANAAGITVTAALLLMGLSRRDGQGRSGRPGGPGSSRASGGSGGPSGSRNSRNSTGYGRPVGPDASGSPGRYGGLGGFGGGDPGDSGEIGSTGGWNAPGGPGGSCGPSDHDTSPEHGNPDDHGTSLTSRTPRTPHRPADPAVSRSPARPARPAHPARSVGRIGVGRVGPVSPSRGRHRRPRGVPVGARRVLRDVSRPVCAAVPATAAGAWAASGPGPGSPLAGLAVGAVTVTGVFVLVGRALDAPGLALALRTVRTVTRRGTHVLLRRHP